MIDDIKLEIKKNTSEEEQVLEKSVVILQSLIRRNDVMKKYKHLFKDKVHMVLHSPDTIRITPAKFMLPLYLVQRTFFKIIFGNNRWEKIKKKINNVWYLSFIGLYWAFSLSLSALIIFDLFPNLFYVFSTLIVVSIFIYISVYLSFHDQILYLMMSSMNCKIYMFVTLFSCIGMSDLFRDWRNIQVWCVIFPTLMILPLSDCIPKYLDKLRGLIIWISLFTLIVIGSIVFRIIFGFVRIYPREFSFKHEPTIQNVSLGNVTYSNIKDNNLFNDKEIVTLSSVSYTVSFLQTLMFLMLKKIMWYFRNPDRAIVLRSSVLITTVSGWHYPKLEHSKNYKFSSLKMKSEKKEKINILHIKPNFIFNGSL